MPASGICFTRRFVSLCACLTRGKSNVISETRHISGVSLANKTGRVHLIFVSLFKYFCSLRFLALIEEKDSTHTAYT